MLRELTSGEEKPAAKLATASHRESVVLDKVLNTLLEEQIRADEGGAHNGKGTGHREQPPSARDLLGGIFCTWDDDLQPLHLQ